MDDLHKVFGTAKEIKLEYSKESKEDLKRIGKENLYGYIYIIVEPENYKKKTIYTGKSKRLDSYNMNHYPGSGKDYLAYISNGINERRLIKRIIAFAETAKELSDLEMFFIGKYKPRFNKNGNGEYFEKKNKKFLSLKEEAAKFKPTMATREEIHQQAL